ncbi:hypothetical protein GLAREA_12719 [Glarea lozoyensis ATCC 20868]|uniref:Uncharacterized protein n=1 Tax=Glarea lozoyensis (strain ATCC 20868 / MF5171) TaxID=1116229 RepID=S3DHB6_GLAL2|nr:uncharacterized protein GLAREA_12719 [Glarea lozoyensis ATCC 20868]EPE31416.1 hypothetical protein GLAREA_12719 [Glarea lozoyensis ATCC 20868]
MGRPKEKEVNFNTSFEDHRVGGTDESRKRRKRKSRNSSVTNDVPLLESDNETNTPCSSSTSNITTTISQAVQIEAAMPPAALGLPLQDISSSVESGIAGDILGCNESANLNVQAPRKDYGYKPNIVTTLLIFATYSSLLIEYEKLVNFLTLSRDSNDKQDVSAPSLSPSLNLGSFKMTATSKLYVGTLLHVIKQMLEQLRKTFDTSFPMHKDLRLHDQHLAEDFELVDRSKEGSADSNFNSPVITAAHDILLEISKKEKQLTHILSTE